MEEIQEIRRLDSTIKMKKRKTSLSKKDPKDPKDPKYIVNVRELTESEEEVI